MKTLYPANNLEERKQSDLRGFTTENKQKEREMLKIKHLPQQPCETLQILAFETNPINKGNSVTSLSNVIKTQKVPGGEDSYLAQIEEKLLVRAGNPVVNPFNTSKLSKVDSKPKVYGEGISETEIKKIIDEFNS